MIIDLVLNLVDYIVIFIITTLAVLFGTLGAIAVSLGFIADKLREATHPDRREYMNEHEKSYRRKTI